MMEVAREQKKHLTGDEIFLTVEDKMVGSWDIYLHQIQITISMAVRSYNLRR